MAKTAHSTPTPTPLPSRRRALFAGVGAVILGSGISSGVAASVADLVLLETDAELIAFCGRFNEIELQCRAIGDAAHTHEDDERADILIDELHGSANHAEWPVLNGLCSTPGSSHAASIALARSIAIWNTGKVIAPSDDPHDYVSDRLMGALMRSLLANA